jgi:nitroreductase
MANVIDLIMSRRSIRQYADQPVPRELLEELLRAAMAAPSAVNARPWEFVVATDPAVLAEFRAQLRYGRHNAPAAIIVCGHPGIATSQASAELFWVQDCSAATENILLAAAGLGLGTVWCGVHPVPQNVETVAKIVGLPPGVTPLNLIWVGYPAEVKPARTQYDEARVHWDRYAPAAAEA